MFKTVSLLTQANLKTGYDTPYRDDLKGSTDLFINQVGYINRNRAHLLISRCKYSGGEYIPSDKDFGK
jgi:hypothetical protein